HNAAHANSCRRMLFSTGNQTPSRELNLFTGSIPVPASNPLPEPIGSQKRARKPLKYGIKPEYHPYPSISIFCLDFGQESPDKNTRHSPKRVLRMAVRLESIAANLRYIEEHEVYQGAGKLERLEERTDAIAANLRTIEEHRD